MTIITAKHEEHCPNSQYCTSFHLFLQKKTTFLQLCFVLFLVACSYIPLHRDIGTLGQCALIRQLKQSCVSTTEQHELQESLFPLPLRAQWGIRGKGQLLSLRFEILILHDNILGFYQLQIFIIVVLLQFRCDILAEI